jgi:O-6-methylguanine DNA methyltransferase
MQIYYSSIQTQICTLYLYADDFFLQGIFFSKNENFTNSAIHKLTPILKETTQQLREYFNQQRTTFNIPLNTSGTEFQKKVWASLLKIPYGHTQSYSELAANAGFPKAFRAAGSANGKNHFPILIPCHRVVKSSGEIGEYSGGVKVKKKLLLLEKTCLN